MKIVKGNLITMAKAGEFDVIVHGCNCFCAMGAGIAPQIAEAFINVDGIGPREVDNETTPGDRNKLGSYSLHRWTNPNPDLQHGLNDILVVINAYTQYETAFWPGQCVVDYDAVRSVFRQLGELFSNHPTTRIGYPQIGAGLAGGDWGVISKIINEELEGLDHTCVVYDGT